MSAKSKYVLSTLDFGMRLNSAISLGSNINLGRMENGKIFSSFGLGLFMKSYPDYRNEMNNANSFWRWFRSEKMKDILSFGLTFHNIPIHNIKNERQLRVGVALRPSASTPLIHFAYHLTPHTYSFHLGTQLNLMKRVDIFLGMKDFDVNELAVGALARFSPFSFEVSYLPDVQQYHFSFYFTFSENRIEISRKYKNRGAQYVKKNDYIKALNEYEKAVSYNQDDAKLNLLISVLQDKVNERKKEIDRKYEDAFGYEKQGFFGTAYLAYRNILEIDPHHKATLKRINHITPKLGDYLDQVYQQALSFNNDKEFDKARILFNKILKIAAMNTNTVGYIAKIDSIRKIAFDQYYIRGIGYYEQKNYARANEEFNIALKIIPDHVKALEYHKSILSELDKKQKRIDRLLAEAKIFERRNNYVRANNRYRQVLRQDRNNMYAAAKVKYLKSKIAMIVERKYRAAKNSFDDKNYSAAIAGFKEILAINSSHRASKKYLQQAQFGLTKLINDHYQKAKRYFNQKKWKEASDQCNIVLSYNSKHEGAQNLNAIIKDHLSLDQLKKTAEAYFQNGKYREAFEHYSKIVERIPNDKSIQQKLKDCEEKLNTEIEEKFNAGMVNYSEGDYQEAINKWNKVLELDPNHKSALDYINKASERLKILTDIK